MGLGQLPSGARGDETPLVVPTLLPEAYRPDKRPPGTGASRHDATPTRPFPIGHQLPSEACPEGSVLPAASTVPVAAELQAAVDAEVKRAALLEGDRPVDLAPSDSSPRPTHEQGAAVPEAAPGELATALEPVLGDGARGAAEATASSEAPVRVLDAPSAAAATPAAAAGGSASRPGPPEPAPSSGSRRAAPLAAVAVVAVLAAGAWALLGGGPSGASTPTDATSVAAPPPPPRRPYAPEPEGSAAQAPDESVVPEVEPVGPRRRAKRRRARATELPEVPERAAVVEALGEVKDEVAACRQTRSGVAEVELTIQGTGAVSHARVVGDFSGTPEGSCVARAVRKARVAPFKKPRVRIVYPFTL